jgi:hypothetical protein
VTAGKFLQSHTLYLQKKKVMTILMKINFAVCSGAHIGVPPSYEAKLEHYKTTRNDGGG